MARVASIGRIVREYTGYHRIDGPHRSPRLFLLGMPVRRERKEDGTMEPSSDDPVGATAGESLLAVDLGLWTGLALFGRDGRLRWYRSHHFAGRKSLRRGVVGLLDEHRGIVRLVIEGGGLLSRPWINEAKQREIPVTLIAAEVWRRRIFGEGHDLGRAAAKRAAGVRARRVITWSGAPNPTALRHDTAEAILIGFWGALECGWIGAIPAGLL